MKISCTVNNTSELETKKTDTFGINKKEQYYLTKGEEYTVYAVGEISGNTWYSILDGGSNAPLWNPSILFEITDNRLSRHWVFSLEENEGFKTTFLSFPEWANDPYYYGNLIEGESDDPTALVFRRYKDLMDLEFPDKNIEEIAQVGNESWLICPCCLDAWECNNTLDGMVKCPKCTRIIHNPRYAEL